MSNSESLSSSNEGSNGCPDYEIEDETSETSSKIANESGPSYVVEEEFVEDEDEFTPYADEPLADHSWTEAYERRQEEKNSEMEEVCNRLNGQNPISAWCKCGHCSIELLVEARECRCCYEIPKCIHALKIALGDHSKSQMCITNHPGFDAVCLNRWSLELASDKFKTHSGHRYRQVDTKDRFLRGVAYRQFTRLVHGILREKRIPLPACAYNAIRTTFKEKDDRFKGYEELQETDSD